MGWSGVEWSGVDWGGVESLLLHFHLKVPLELVFGDAARASSAVAGVVDEDVELPRPKHACHLPHAIER